jgi:ribosomal protein S14
MLFIKNINWINKDKIIRKLYSKYEIKKLVLKGFLYNNFFNHYNKIFFDFKFKKFIYKSSISKCRSNCMFLGNSRSIIQKFKLSRYSSKKFAGMGFITGIKKSSF